MPLQLLSLFIQASFSCCLVLKHIKRWIFEQLPSTFRLRRYSSHGEEAKATSRGAREKKNPFPECILYSFPAEKHVSNKNLFDSEIFYIFDTFRWIESVILILLGFLCKKSSFSLACYVFLVWFSPRDIALIRSWFKLREREMANNPLNYLFKYSSTVVDFVPWHSSWGWLVVSLS